MNSQKPKRTRDYLTREEVNKLLQAAKEGATRNSERDHAAITLLANHAMRVSELCDLRISDINLNGEPSIYIRHEKGGEPSVHPLFKSDVAALRKWLTIREGLELAHGYLFCSEQQTKLNRATINLMITAVAKHAGLEHLRPHPHSFRSSCLTHLLNQGENIRNAQDWAGHRSIITTSRYVKLCPDRFKNFAKLF